MVNIVAEIGCNHMGDAKTAIDMILSAFKNGADYVKFQKRFPKECLTPEQYDKVYYSENGFGETYGQHREALEISINDWVNIIRIVKGEYPDKSVFPSVFDIKSLSEVCNCSVSMPFVKVGSGDIDNIELLKECAKSGSRVIISTGMSTIEEIDKAYEIIKDSGPVLMHTTSVYPCPEEHVNLNVIKTLKKRYGCEIGLSGHYVSGSGAIEVAAMMLGATWFERHYTLDRTWKGTDHAASLEPVGLARVVKSIMAAERALGGPEKKVLEIEEPVRRKHRGC